MSKKMSLIVLSIFFLVSCSPKSTEDTQGIESNINSSFENLIIFENVKMDVLADSSSVLKNANGAVIGSNSLSIDIEEDDTGIQLIELINNERRSNVSMSIAENTPTIGISLEHSCPAQLRRRQRCTLKINIDANSISVGANVSYPVTINGTVYNFNYNVIASTKLTPEEEAEGLIEQTPLASTIDFGSLIVNRNDKKTEIIQLRNKSRKSLPVIIDDSGLSDISYSTSCGNSLNRNRGCFIFLNMDSSGKSALSINESIIVLGKTYNLTGTYVVQTAQEIEDEANILAQNSIVIDPSGSIDLGDVDLGRTIIKNIKIRNISRNSINLNIDGSSLVSHSIGTCPLVLSRFQSCSLNVILDTSSLSVGSISENITIADQSYNILSNVVDPNAPSSLVQVEFYDVDSNKVTIIQEEGLSTCGPNCSPGEIGGVLGDLYKTGVVGIDFSESALLLSAEQKCISNGGNWFGSRYCGYNSVPSSTVIEECVMDNGYYSVINDTISPRCVYHDNIGFYVKISYSEIPYISSIDIKSAFLENQYGNNTLEWNNNDFNINIIDSTVFSGQKRVEFINLNSITEYSGPSCSEFNGGPIDKDDCYANGGLVITPENPSNTPCQLGWYCTAPTSSAYENLDSVTYDGQLFTNVSSSNIITLKDTFNEDYTFDGLHPSINIYKDNSDMMSVTTTETVCASSGYNQNDCVSNGCVYNITANQCVNPGYNPSSGTTFLSGSNILSDGESNSNVNLSSWYSLTNLDIPLYRGMTGYAVNGNHLNRYAIDGYNYEGKTGNDLEIVFEDGLCRISAKVNPVNKVPLYNNTDWVTIPSESECQGAIDDYDFFSNL